MEEYLQQGLAENEDDGNIRRAEERGEEALKSASTRKTAEQVSSGSALRVHVFLHRAIGLLSGWSSWRGQRDRQYLFSRSSTDRPSRPGNFIAFSKFGHCSRSEYYLIAPSGSTRGILMANHWRIHSLTSKVSLIFLLYTLFVIWKVFYVEFLSEIPRAMSLNRQVLVVTMTLMSHKFLLKGSWGAGVCCWDYFGALMWYRVEEIFVAADIVNPLSISVQANGLKRDLFWIWGMLICIYLNRSLQSRVLFSKVILLFPLIWKQAITILIFFRIVTNIWLFVGFWHRVCQTFSIYGSAFCAF